EDVLQADIIRPKVTGIKIFERTFIFRSLINSRSTIGYLSYARFEYGMQRTSKNLLTSDYYKVTKRPSRKSS
ncbi:MAG: hypothetical protein ACI8Q3_002694, partial [Marinomonas primoryensis]